MQSADFISIGGGLIGLASAYYFLQAKPHARVLVLEKEADIAQHQSSHNSGVLHSGIFWPPNSQKAQHTRAGQQLLRDFCERENIDYAICGKLIVAGDSAEIPQLNALHQQAVANNIACQLLDSDSAHAIEPQCHAVAALHIPSSGVVDYAAVARRLALRIEMLGGQIKTRSKVIGLLERPEGIIVQTEQASFVTPYLVNAAGLHADRLAHKLGLAQNIKILPFRGDYFRLNSRASDLINGQIFPIPNADLPFTGIHLTRGLDGTVLAGPNAVLAGSREGYRKGNIKLRDTLDQLTSRRVRRLTRQHFATALWEKRRSLSKELFAMTVQRLVPAISADDLLPAPSGVSTYAITPEGQLLTDFVVESTPRSVHLLSLPTPGATACLSFGRTLAQTALDHA